jgi:hypothetical protein
MIQKMCASDLFVARLTAMLTLHLAVVNWSQIYGPDKGYGAACNSERGGSQVAIVSTSIFILPSTDYFSSENLQGAEMWIGVATGAAAALAPAVFAIGTTAWFVTFARGIYQST